MTDAARKLDPLGYVYFVGSEHSRLVKIGYSIDPQRRLMNMQIGCPHRLQIITAMRAAPEVEGHIHKLFSTDREHGEWFRLSPRLEALIRELEQGRDDDVRGLLATGGEPQAVLLPSNACQAVREMSGSQRARVVGALRQAKPPVAMTPEQMGHAADLLAATFRAVFATQNYAGEQAND